MDTNKILDTVAAPSSANNGGTPATRKNALPSVRRQAGGGSRRRKVSRTGLSADGQAKKGKKQEQLSAKELRAARALRITVTESGDGGWIAQSESVIDERYLIYQHPEGHLTCTCADYIFRSNDYPQFNCKHTNATYVFVGQQYLRGHLPEPFTFQSPSSGGEDRLLLH